ncbi:MAG: hypothetical protein KBC84_10140, partial [Proteobacteria bacterium]|nr:hypothetical protein [Pseudomonadota bacterium]
AQLFAYNLFQDSPREFLLQKFDLLKTRYPNLSDKYTICQERGLGGKLMLEDLPLLLFTLAPVADSKIQEIKFLI